MKKRVHQSNMKHPNNKVDKAGRVKLYVQARKEVDNHAVRKYQRSFVKHLDKWAANKVFTEQERLKGVHKRKTDDDHIVELEKRREENEARLEGKDPPAKELVKANEDAPASAKTPQ